MQVHCTGTVVACWRAGPRRSAGGPADAGPRPAGARRPAYDVDGAAPPAPPPAFLPRGIKILDLL